MRTLLLLTLLSTCLFLSLLGLPQQARAQDRPTLPDSLRQRLLSQPNDTNRVMLLIDLAFNYRNTRPDTAYRLVQQGYALARRLSYPLGQAHALNVMGPLWCNWAITPAPSG
ncbi:hypothetical protein H9L05_16010 [Hymenobacter qilianensis]|uniref:Tetratricopeptide repeat protein n=1 Tax=Hymenobacter qilianensis TaxID=1385715 RepID=A0A7H0GT90_9BACT|nr:hypothetical protein [Hymenobacter qilianensis]QNP51506.1 hypothetical protein H9L05_16010 [Hymenobacter qilianensis]